MNVFQSTNLEMNTINEPTAVYTVFVTLDEIRTTLSRGAIVQNRVTALFTQSNLIHCETHFPENQRTFAITSATPAQWYTGKQFAGRSTVLVSHVTRRQYERLCDIFDEFEGCTFDRWWWSRVSWCTLWHSIVDVLCRRRRRRRCRRNTVVTCAQLLAEAYTDPEVAMVTPQELRVEPFVATPQHLYDALLRHGAYLLPRHDTTS